jgi:putative membrane protein
MVAVHPLFALWGIFFGLVVMVAVAALVILVARSLMRPHQAPMPPGSPMPMPPARETPLDILARRFASGEITAEEYQRARDLLQGGPSA